MSMFMYFQCKTDIAKILVDYFKRSILLQQYDMCNHRLGHIIFTLFAMSIKPNLNCFKYNFFGMQDILDSIQMSKKMHRSNAIKFFF